MNGGKKRIIVFAGIAAGMILLGLVLIFTLFPKQEGVGTRLLDKGIYEEKAPVLAAQTVYPMCIHERGIFYFKGAALGYYDYDAQEDFVLCSAKNCRHLSKDCNAYTGNYRICGGYALYQGRIYLIAVPLDSSEAQLISMDMTGENKKIVARWDAGKIERGSWHLSVIKDVIYDQGYAYVNAGMFRSAAENETTNADQLLAIRISDKTVIPLTGLVEYNDNRSEMLSAQFEHIGASGIIFSTERFDSPQKTSLSKTYYFFDPESGSITDTKVVPETYIGDEENAYEWGYDYEWCPQTEFLGEYQGKWILKETKEGNPANGAVYSLLDPPTQQKQSFFETFDGNISFFFNAWGQKRNVLWDNAYLLGAEKLSDDTEQIFRLFPENGKRENLFVRDRDFSSEMGASLSDANRMELLGETEKYFVGQMFAGSGGGYFFIPKEAFLKNDLKSAIRCR